MASKSWRSTRALSVDPIPGPTAPAAAFPAPPGASDLPGEGSAPRNAEGGGAAISSTGVWAPAVRRRRHLDHQPDQRARGPGDSPESNSSSSMGSSDTLADEWQRYGPDPENAQIWFAGNLTARPTSHHFMRQRYNTASNPHHSPTSPSQSPSTGIDRTLSNLSVHHSMPPCEEPSRHHQLTPPLRHASLMRETPGTERPPSRHGLPATGGSTQASLSSDAPPTTRMSQDQGVSVYPNHRASTSPTSPRAPRSPMSSCHALPSPMASAEPSGRDEWPGLRLPNFPRFHPAVFQQSSDARPAHNPSPSTGRARYPGGSTLRSPHAGSGNHKRSFSAMQREVVANAARAAATLEHPVPRTSTPRAPTLQPHGSPGPATPLQLEAEDYLTAGAATAAHESPAGRMLRESGSPPVSPRC